MTPLDIIATIRRSGGSITVVGGDLRIEAPAETLSTTRTALVEHKALIVRLLAPDEAQAEREAVQWVESLSDDEGSQIVSEAVREWDEITGNDWINHHDDQGRLSLVRSGWNDDEIEVDPVACGSCGGLLAWWDATGGRHCTKCDPPAEIRIKGRQYAKQT